MAKTTALHPNAVTGMLYPGMKIDRATEHLKELQAASAAFKLKAYTITKYDDVERQQHIVRVTLNDMDPIIPLLLGEFVQSMRASLDYLAWQLSLLSGRPPSRSSAFPMHSSDGREDRERFIRCTWNIPCEAIEIIKQFQPYLAGDRKKSHPLWQLNRLANLDKHQTIGYHVTVLKAAPVSLDGGPFPHFRNLQDSQSVEFFTHLSRKGKVDVETEPPDLIFGKPPESPGASFDVTEENITAIHNFVRHEVLPRFTRFFAKP